LWKLNQIQVFGQTVNAFHINKKKKENYQSSWKISNMFDILSQF